MVSQVMNLVFRHLYDNRWAAFVKKSGRWDEPVIIFPQGFEPQHGRSYTCNVRLTATGRFVYDEVEYQVAHATDTESASFVDEIDFMFPLKKADNQASSMAEALRRAGVVA